MEGASFAQVAQQEKIDWIVMRVISILQMKNKVRIDTKNININLFGLINYFLNYY